MLYLMNVARVNMHSNYLNEFSEIFTYFSVWIWNVVGGRTVINMEESSKRRPFFSTAEDLYDDEYFDEQLPEKKRRLTPEQVYNFVYLTLQKWE